MKLIFVNRFFHPDHSATSQLLSDLARHLALRGHEVHVICSRQLYEDPEARLPAEDVVDGVQVHRAWSTTFGRQHLPGRLVDYLSFYVGAWAALRRHCDRRAIVVAKTDPPLISVIAAQVVRARGARLVNWMQDVFPEIASHLDIRLLQGRLGRMVKAVRDRSLRSAATNVVLGERMARLVADCGVDDARIRVIANWSDGRSVAGVAKEGNGLLAEWGLQGRFVLMYSGNMGRAHEFDTLLEAAALLADDPRYVFLFVGGGPKRAEVQRAVAERGLRNVVFKPYQPAERLGESLSVGDVHLISLIPALEGLIVPSKFYGVLAAGRPSLFVGDADGELARVIRRHRVGRSVEIGDSAGLVAAIRDYSHGESAREDGARARELLLARYERSIALAEWERMLEQAGAGS
jgi:glycosyltransferase involved in cell wall biosynthesis